MSRLGTLIVAVLAVFLGAVATPASAQDLSPEEAALLDGRLRVLLAQEVPDTGLPDLGASSVEPVADPGLAKSGESRYAVVLTTRNGETLRDRGFPIQTATERVATARVTPREMVALAQSGLVDRIAPSVRLEPHNDEAAGVSGVRLLNNGRLNGTAYTGQGVAACVIDSGLDYTHEDFRELADPSQTRVLSIWDQTLSAQTGESTPSGYGYGVEYTEADVEDEIDGTPAGFIRQVDATGHGTHVAGTMAGNSGADPERRYVGMAPDASLIIVKTNFQSSGVIDALEYCSTVASNNNVPVVANLSLGSDYGPHDGTSSLDVGVSDWSAAASGRVAVTSAGNTGDNAIHTAATASAGAAASFQFTIPAYTEGSGADNDDLYATIWFDGAPSVTVTVTSPNGASLSTSSGDAMSNTADGRIEILDNGVSPSNGDREIIVGVTDGDATQTPVSGTWTVEIQNDETMASASYHAWLYDDAIGASSTPVEVDGGNTDYTVGSPGSALDAVGVGSYVHRWRWCADGNVDGDSSNDPDCYFGGTPDRSDDISGFSSRGPLRGVSQMKPDVAAPGEKMASSASDDMSLSATSSRLAAGGQHRYTQGTSMSSPVVAGIAVLLLQENPSLTASQIRDAIQQGARADGYTGPLPNDTWGYGKADAVGAMTHVLDPSQTAQREIFAYDEWAGGGDLNVGDNLISVRFTPGFAGKTSGVLFHTGQFTNAPGTVSIEIRSDDGSGTPGALLGSTVVEPGASLFKSGWNYVEVSDANVSVTPGASYHVVLYADAGQALVVKAEAQSVDGRTSTRLRSGTSWSTQGYDARIRPVVSVSGAPGVLPVELAGFRGVPGGDRAVLSWQTLSETNNDGFIVQQAAGDSAGESASESADASTAASAEGEAFRRIGFVDGAGTTAEPQSYTFRTGALDPGVYRFRLLQVDADGTETPSAEQTVRIGLQQPYTLTQIAPNPISDVSGSLVLRVREAEKVRVELYNVLGQRVQVLDDEVVQPDTRHEITIDGSRLSSGVYFVRVDGESFQATRKFVRVR